MIGPYLLDSVTLKQFTGADIYGTPTATTDLTVKVRIDYKNRQITGLDGNLVVSKAKVQMRTRDIIRTGFSTRAVNTIAYEDLITFDGVDNVIIQISKVKDFTTRFLEVYTQ